MKYVKMPRNLTSQNAPAGVSSTIFLDCTALKKVTFYDGFTKTPSNYFTNIASNTVIDLPATMTAMDSKTIRTDRNGTAIYVMRGDVGAFDALKQTSKVSRIYVKDEYFENYQTYLAGNGNLSKLYRLSE